MKHIRVGERPLGFSHLEEHASFPIKVVLGKRVRKLEAAMVEWENRGTTSSFFKEERAGYIQGGEHGLALACAAQGKLDLELFGGKQ